MSTPDEHRRNLEKSGNGEMRKPVNILPSLETVQAPKATFQQTERLLVELLATIGHEFRTPLTVINGYTSTLLRRDGQLSPEEQREFLHMIKEASNRLASLPDLHLALAHPPPHP